MKHSHRKGIAFGLTSGVITTLGLMIGLNAGTHSKTAVIGGILTIAIADAFSDALGIHLSEEAKKDHKDSEVWEATVSTFFSKLFFALTFIVPVLFFADLSDGIIASALWGISLLVLLSYLSAREQQESVLQVVGEHLLIAFIVIVATYYVGAYIAEAFPS